MNNLPLVFLRTVLTKFCFSVTHEKSLNSALHFFTGFANSDLFALARYRIFFSNEEITFATNALLISLLNARINERQFTSLSVWNAADFSVLKFSVNA